MIICLGITFVECKLLNLHPFDTVSLALSFVVITDERWHYQFGIWYGETHYELACTLGKKYCL